MGPANAPESQPLSTLGIRIRIGLWLGRIAFEARLLHIGGQQARHLAQLTTALELAHKLLQAGVPAQGRTGLGGPTRGGR